MFLCPKADDESTKFFLTLPHSAKEISISEACSMPAKRKRHNSFVLPQLLIVGNGILTEMILYKGEKVPEDIGSRKTKKLVVFTKVFASCSAINTCSWGPQKTSITGSLLYQVADLQSSTLKRQLEALGAGLTQQDLLVSSVKWAQKV